MLDYKEILVKKYVLHMSGREIAETLGCSKSGVNDFLTEFNRCSQLSYPLPDGITNYGIYQRVYGKTPGIGERNTSYELPDFAAINHQMQTRHNMTLIYQWNRYMMQCTASELKYYSYRQFCSRYTEWCKDNMTDAHFNAAIGQNMEVDFAGKTFVMVSPLTGEVIPIVVFVAILPYSQYIYAEGMVSTKEPQWIQANNNAVSYFGGIPPIVICDNCKQAVMTNADWIAPELNKDYAEWAEHNGTVILPAKVRKPKYKSSVENAVGILEKGFFHVLEERPYFSLHDFNTDLWEELGKLNHAPFKKKEHNRAYYWEEEKLELLPLPATHYEYMERREATVAGDYHVRFDNAYYSVDQAFKHKKVSLKATTDTVKIYSKNGDLICEHPRALHKGEWVTDASHLPKSYNNYSDWSAEYFIRKAMTIGPHTVSVIRAILASRKYEVQTYRCCLGVIQFVKKYSKPIVELACQQALEQHHVTYTHLKTMIPYIAEKWETPVMKSQLNEERNKGGFIMEASSMDVGNLLSKSQQLATLGKKVRNK